MELGPIHRDAEPLMHRYDDVHGGNAKIYEADQPYAQETWTNPLSFKARFAGWRRSLLLGSAMSVVVLLFNIGFTGWAVQHHHVQGDKGVLYEGDCDTVRNGSIAFHIVINIFSTILLSASNYCMQCLSAPTRSDIDSAHQRGTWLDIGVPSVRNLFQVSKKRSRLWICLSLSSLPLHLLYNSTIFSSISANAYDVFAGSGSPNQTALTTIKGDLTDDGSRDVFLRLHEKAQNGSLYQLDNAACVDAYATSYQSTYGSLILVTDTVTPADHYSLLYSQTVFGPSHQALVGESGFNWLCQDLEGHDYLNRITPCITALPQVREHVAANNWTVSGYRVDYCLSEKTPPHCKLQYSLPLVVIVIVFNVVKAVILFYVAFAETDTPILTTGDAVASFLAVPDQFSTGICLLPVDAIRKPTQNGGPIAFDRAPKRWRSAISRRRWVLGLSSYSTALGACILLLVLGLTLSFDTTGIWSVGLGQVGTQSLLSSGGYWDTSVIANSILANLPQLIFSVLYFAFNGMLTTMTLAHEWSQYALQRKGLRVSSCPVGTQRKTYFLSLPFRYAIPFIILSTIIHWLISESLFLVMVEAYTVNLVRDPIFDVTTCGYSPVAIVATIGVGVMLLVSVVGVSYRRFKSGMPVAGSSSLVIAAACHPLDPRPNAPYLPLQWGAIRASEGVRRCAFSSTEVEMPEHGWVYQ